SLLAHARLVRGGRCLRKGAAGCERDAENARMKQGSNHGLWARARDFRPGAGHGQAILTQAHSGSMSTLATAAPATFTRPVSFLLNVGHAVDHMFLLIFATA